ncbi:low specificity L-threonine aldolase [Ruminococcus sp. TM10-9AT]|nr:low specificity L-threonine aldolase [Ruminococcus sp. TM10-9AT]
MNNIVSRLYFASDYMEGAHPAIMQKLVETNLEKTVGYGLDPYTESAKEKIRTACNAPDADVFLLVGGTQTNATVIDALLKSYQGVVAAETGHIATHESGAIEFGGHKVLTLPQKDGKVRAAQIEKMVKDFYDDANYEHMVMPGMVYISQPTEYGTLYSKEELTEISKVCRANHLPLYVDGARLAYALASPENDVTLSDLAELCDAFYIGGTKCGALFGEAVVIPQKGLIPHFFTIIKQHGALLAKGRIAGIQFDELFTDGLYERIGKPAIDAAEQIKEALKKFGYKLALDTPTNQIFCIVSNKVMEKIAQDVKFGFWEKYDETHSVIRFATSWATTMEDTQKLIRLLDDIRK